MPKATRCPTTHKILHSQDEQGVTNFTQDAIDLMIMDYGVSLVSMTPSTDTHPQGACYQPLPSMPHTDTQVVPDSSIYGCCMHIYSAVAATGQPNFVCARKPLPSGLNISAWKRYLTDYHQDPLLVDFLAFGWPMNYVSHTVPSPTLVNHASADAYPTSIATYLNTEVQQCAMLGPFTQPPFEPWCHISPLMTRPKKNTQDRRVILDLSCPHNHSVNDGIPKEIYLGEKYKLHLPTVDNLVELIKVKGQGCWLYSVDLARAYRQLRSDPLDWPLLGIQWNAHTYIDISIPFGIRWGAMACHRTTSAVCWLMNKCGHDLLNYIDDFAGAELSQEDASAAFNQLRTILQDVGLQESRDKAIAPTQCLQWIGVEFDTVKMQIRMPKRKIDDTLSLLTNWSHKHRCTRTHLRKLLGKLFHIAQCCKPARLFVSRMLGTLRSAPQEGYVTLSTDFQKDIQWFLAFLPLYNGVHLIQTQQPRIQVEVDSCLTGCGGMCGQEFYSTLFPDYILDEQWHISRLEMLNILIAVKLWAAQWISAAVTIYCDNSAAVAVLTHGRSRDSVLLSCAREIWYYCARYDINLEVVHKPGVDMITADALSRQHMHPVFQAKVSELIHKGLTPLEVAPHLCKLCTEL